MKKKLTYIAFAILFFVGTPALLSVTEKMTFLGAIASLIVYFIVMFALAKQVNKYA